MGKELALMYYFLTEQDLQSTRPPQSSASTVCSNGPPFLDSCCNWLSFERRLRGTFDRHFDPLKPNHQ